MQLQRLEGAELERTLADLVRAIVASLDPERILLFGSFARGDQNRASDIDLVVVEERAGLGATPFTVPEPREVGRGAQLEGARGKHLSFLA
jgi:predicted nucleotidyltransferase